MNQKTKMQGTRVWIEGVDHYRVCEPLFESVRIVLSYRGEKYSPEYIQGISGAAFRIAGICPCAPTCSTAMQPEELARLLGYEVRRLILEDKDAGHIKALADAFQTNAGVLPGEDKLDSPQVKEMRGQLIRIIDEVKNEIRAGRPAIVWHAFTAAEFDVVVGFDDDKGTFLGRGSYAGTATELASAPQARTVTAVYIGGPPGAILLGEKVRPFDARAAEIAALKEVVRHARSQENKEKLGGKEWVMLQGLMCYDRWIQDFKDPAKKLAAGDAYCYGVYRSTHKAAAGFLREIAPKHRKARKELEDAAERFDAEAAALATGEALLWWSAPEGPDAARNERAVKMLTEARAHYARGIESIEHALAHIEAGQDTAQPGDPPEAGGPRR